VGVDGRGLPSHELAFNHGDGLARFDGCGAGHGTNDPRPKRHAASFLTEALEPWIGAGHGLPRVNSILSPPRQPRPRPPPPPISACGGSNCRRLGSAASTAPVGPWHRRPHRWGRRRGEGEGCAGGQGGQAMPWPAHRSRGGGGLRRHSHSQNQVGCSRHTPPKPKGIPAAAPS